MSTKPITADILLRDIRAHCVDCMGGQRVMVAFCTSKKCRLWPHRLAADEINRDDELPTDGDVERMGRQMSMMEISD